MQNERILFFSEGVRLSKMEETQFQALKAKLPGAVIAQRNAGLVNRVEPCAAIAGRIPAAYKHAGIKVLELPEIKLEDEAVDAKPLPAGNDSDAELKPLATAKPTSSAKPSK